MSSNGCRYAYVHNFNDVLMFGHDTIALEREAFRPKREFFKVSDPRARGSAEGKSQAMLARPASDPFLAGHDPTQPVSV